MNLLFWRISPALLLTCTCLFAQAQTESDYEKQLDELAATIQMLQQELANTKSSRNKLEKSLQESEEEIGSITKNIETIKEALAREKKQLNQLKNKRVELEQSRQQQQQQINRAVRQAYLLGRQSHFKLLLNQEAPYRVSRLLRYHDYIVGAHKKKLDAYLSTLVAIETIEAEAVEVSKRLENKQNQLEKRFSEVKNIQSQRLATLSKINQELSLKGGSLQQMRKDQERLQKLLDEASKALSQLQLPGDAKPFRQVRGKLPRPTKGRIAHNYGSPRLSGKLRWNGIFIRGKEGSKVVSVHHGRVIFSDYLRGHGLLLIIDHGDGYMSLYAHNRSLLKELGDWVSSGEQIATMGNTGGLSQAGLYFEIRHNGKPQNPKPWLTRS